MSVNPLIAANSQHEFDAASRDSLLLELAAVLTGRERTLLPLSDALRAAGMDGQVDRGEREIPLDRIKGSENRTRDFDATFHPLRSHLRDRWTRLYSLIDQGLEMPPIEVYQVGEVYFVKDGHHRVSIARRMDWPVIRAHVVEVRTRAPLSADVNPELLLEVAEYATFLERAQLDRVRPEARLRCSRLGRYDVIFEHILGHRYFMGVEQHRDVSIPDAAASWYDTVYRPLMDVAERHGLAAELPGWTETDIYLALTRLWLDLGQEGRPAGPGAAVHALLDDAPALRRGSRRRRALRSLRPASRRRLPAGSRAGRANRLLQAISSGVRRATPGPRRRG
jgi:hypothetical protein